LIVKFFENSLVRRSGT